MVRVKITTSEICIEANCEEENSHRVSDITSTVMQMIESAVVATNKIIAERREILKEL